MRPFNLRTRMIIISVKRRPANTMREDAKDRVVYEFDDVLRPLLKTRSEVKRHATQRRAKADNDAADDIAEDHLVERSILFPHLHEDVLPLRLLRRRYASGRYLCH
jgi:hypothetical protein